MKDSQNNPNSSQLGHVILFLGMSTTGKSTTISALKEKDPSWIENGMDLYFKNHEAEIKDFTNNHDERMEYVVAGVFKEAKEALAQGKRVILDFTPLLTIDLNERFRKDFKKYADQTSVVTPYCSLTQLGNRLEKRNKQAKKDKNLHNIRDRSHVSIWEHAQLFDLTTDPSKEYLAITQISPQDVEDFVAKVGNPEQKDIVEMISEIGFSEGIQQAFVIPKDENSIICDVSKMTPKLVALTIQNQTGLKKSDVDKVLTTIPDPDWEENSKKPQETIEQFTQKGLEVAISYYNQKYPDRGEITPIIADRSLEGLQNVANAHKNGLDWTVLANNLNEETAKTVVAQFQNLPKGETHKILFTLCNTDQSGQREVKHSIPLIVTDNKLIMMRNEAAGNWQYLDYEDSVKGLMPRISEQLGLEFVQSIQTTKEKDGKTLSTLMQGDYSTCHFIALGVLKDLTQEDLQQVAEFENGFEPLPKSLKYSQSEKRMKDALSKESLAKPVKKTGETALQYRQKHKDELKEQNNPARTRINAKSDEFKENLAQIAEKLGENAPSEVIATKILHERQAAKAGRSLKIDPKTAQAESEIVSNLPSPSPKGTPTPTRISTSGKSI